MLSIWPALYKHMDLSDLESQDKNIDISEKLYIWHNAHNTGYYFVYVIYA